MRENIIQDITERRNCNNNGGKSAITLREQRENNLFSSKAVKRKWERLRGWAEIKRIAEAEEDEDISD